MITKSFKPSLNATATERVNGWVSKEVGWSFWLKVHSQASILSKLVEDIWSYLIAFIFFYAESTKNIFFVGIMHMSSIFSMKRVEVKIDWIGDLNVYTRVSCSKRLNTTGNILPGGSIWLFSDCSGTLI